MILTLELIRKIKRLLRWTILIELLTLRGWEEMKAFSHLLWFTVELKPAVAALYQTFVHFLFQLVVLWLKTLIFSILLHFWNNPSSSFSLMPPATCHYITAQFAASQVLLLQRLIYSRRNSGTSPVSQNNISFSCVINPVVARALISLCGGPRHKQAICLMIHNPLHAECWCAAIRERGQRWQTAGFMGAGRLMISQSFVMSHQQLL